MFINLLLKYRYKFFKRWLKKSDFLKNKNLAYSTNFKSIADFKVIDNEFYNDNDVWFSKDCVNLTDDGLEICCKKDYAHHTSWNGDKFTNWTSGMIQSYDFFEFVNGIWVFEAKVCDSWPAIWLLRKEHNEPGYKRGQITPEIDIMEVIKGKLRTTIHYGYDDIVYKRHEKGSNIIKPDDKFHQFAVELLSNGYNFYFDGILVSTFKEKDKEFTSDVPCYVIINNAANDTDKKQNYNLVVKSMEVYYN